MLLSAELRSYGLWWRARCHAVALALGIALSPPAAQPHDPDVWGGLFRTQDAGATWSPVNPGVFVSGALALAVVRATRITCCSRPTAACGAHATAGGIGRSKHPTF